MTTRKKKGNVDAIPMGGTPEPRREPAGRGAAPETDRDTLLEDDEPVLAEDNVDDFFEDDDEADRRRDPLRRP